ncbi:signal peptidase II [Candidatus Peregrinibacteria bacterium]|nr:signal peptidase II [Candidatus Peregrinibacteria bacterium]
MPNQSTPHSTVLFKYQGLSTALCLGLLIGMVDINIKQAIAGFFSEKPDSIVVIGDFLNFHLEKNTALAFSIQLPFQIILFLNTAIFILLATYLAKKLNFTNKLAIFIYALLLAGAISNLYERIALGYVTDFIAVGNFPVFNLADSFITISIFLLILFYDRITRPF